MRHTPKKLTDCPENLREAIDWLIQVRHGNGDHGKGLDELAKALKKLIEEAIGNAYTTNIDALLKLLDSAKSYTCCKDKVTKIEELNKSEKAAENTFDNLKNHCKSIRGCSKKHLDSSQQKSFGDIESKLDQLEKLKHSLTGFTNVESCKNLLTNLCDGLETLLGFDSTSKGYNGTGIVYSDLDRLCDGVMGFLSGVLGAVKNENEVTTYDNYITDPEKRLNKVLEKLKSQIGSGRAGLAESVERVKTWLEGYIHIYEKKTDEVTGHLGRLSETISTKISSVSGSASKELTTQLIEWKTTIKTVQTDLNNIETEQIDVLDNALKTRIKHEIKSIQSGIRLLYDSANNDVFTWQAEYVDGILLEQEDKVIRNIAENSRDFHSTVEEYVTKIRSALAIMDTVKNENVERMNRAIAITRDDVDAFDWKYKRRITEKFNVVQSEVNKIYTFLEYKKRELDEFVTQTQEYFYSIKTGIGTKASRLPGTIHGDWDMLTNAIKMLVSQIKGEGSTSLGENKNGLLQLLKGVREYADGFGSGTLDSVVAQWVKEIVQTTQTIVASKISDYATYDKTLGQLPSSTNTYAARVSAIKQAVISVLPEHLHTEIRSVAQKHLKDVNVSNIGSTFNTFANQVSIQLTATSNPSIEAAVVAVGKHLKIAQGAQLQPTSTNPHITAIVTPIVYTVANNLKQVVSELQRFTAMTKIENLTQILKNVSEIETQLESVEEPYHGRKITSALDKIESSITELGTLVGVKIGAVGAIQSKLNGIQNDLTDLYMLRKEKADRGEISIVMKSQEAEQLLENLIWDVKKNLNNIVEVVQSVSSALSYAIEGVQIALVDAQKSLQTEITELQSKLTGVTHDAFADVTAELRTLFAAGHDADLKALQKLVADQKAEVRIILDADERNGLKGLLQTLNGVIIVRKVYGPEFKRSNPNLLDALISSQSARQSDRIADISKKTDAYLNPVLSFVVDQSMTPPPSPCKHFKNNEDSQKVYEIKHRVNKLLQHIVKTNENDNTRTYTFDTHFTSLLSHLSTSLAALQPSAFANPPHPELLDAVKKGLQGFVKEMGRVYVNGYDGHKEKVDMGKLVTNEDGKGEKLSDDGRNLSKVFLTILPILLEDLTKLNDNCRGDWKNEFICEMNNKNENPLGKFLKRCGYKVAKTMTSKDGESECKKSRTGMNIYDKLATRIFDLAIVNHLKDCESNKDVKGIKKKTENFDHFDTLNCLYHHLEIYNDVWHIATWNSTRYPCSIFEMLCWLSGLTHNRVRSSMMGSTINEALANPEEEKQDKGKRDNETEENQRNSDKAAMQWTSDEIEVSLEIASETDPKVSLVSTSSVSLPAYPNNITFANVNAIVTHISATSYDVLTKILGTGNAQTMYACEFSNNTLRLKYPTSGDDCLDMLLDILRRVFAVFAFLCKQCKRRDEYYGWRECQYGMAIPTTKSHCNKKAIDEARCQPTCQAKCEATCQETCQVNCQPTSPLMSYLNDCLPGHLPHQLISVGCKAECKTCSPSSRAMPCLTPLGFRAFSGSTKTGKDLCEIIDKFLNFDDISCLFALVPRPPSTLPEHFQFALSLVDGWDSTSADTLHTWVQSSMKKQSIDLSSGRELTEWLRNTYGYSQVNHNIYHNNSKNAFVRSLCMNKTCSGEGVYCAPYLATLCHESYTYFVKKHVDTYVSWVVYLPWVFHQYLEKLRDAFQDIFCQDWGCHRCMHGDKCKRGKHGHADKKEGEQEKPYCQCLSIVRCKGTSPTFYKYGFTFLSAKKLELNSNYCSAFFSQLENVIKSDYFTKLFDQCDMFLWKTREPFSYLVLSLWLLSLLYLLHIMVIRLDLLHIKSHLHSPSSHRIAAQSLLAAGRVNKLGRVFYLQP